MSPRGRLTLAILMACVGVPIVAVGAASAPSGTGGITVYRCESGGRVTLQDEPCPAGASQTTRRMVRPQDAPPRPPAARPDAGDATGDGAPEPPADDAYAPPAWAAAFPPPPMFQCTDYDGEVRFTEEYAPNTRCVPLPVLGYRVPPGSVAAASCRWVQESCLQLDDASACDRFREKLRQAKSDALHASGSQAPYRKSEAERLERIVDGSC